jgi:serine/threonine protein kinase
MGAAVSSDLSTGSVFAGRYRVERRIGSGGMGAVYEVVHLETNRRRALKVMHPQYVSSDELRARFRQEARVAAEIESEHIVDVFDAGIDEPTGLPFLVMELLRGEELGTLIKRVGPLPKEDVVRYLHETSLALDKTHRARIVHRDLKPDNLFLCQRESGPPRIKVLDFGIAKIVKDAETQANATRSLGTPLYMAPEQFVLRTTVSPAADIFALGMIAFTMLVGKPYWYEESKIASEMVAFVMHVAHGPTESAVARAWEQARVALPNDFDVWFFRVTAREPTARFATADDAVIALARVLRVPLPHAGPITTDPQPPPHPAPEIDPPTILLPQALMPSARAGVTRVSMPPGPTDAPVALDKPRTSRHLPVLVGAAIASLLTLALIPILAGLATDEPKHSSNSAPTPTPSVSNSAAIENNSTTSADQASPAKSADALMPLASGSASPPTASATVDQPSADGLSFADAAAPDAGAFVQNGTAMPRPASMRDGGVSPSKRKPATVKPEDPEDWSQ